VLSNSSFSVIGSTSRYVSLAPMRGLGLSAFAPLLGA
jgi:hypothetical protein